MSFTLNPNIVSKLNEKSEVVIINLEDDHFYFKIDGLAAEAWAMIVEGKSQTEIVHLLAQKYETDPEEFEDKIQELISDLLYNELIKP